MKLTNRERLRWIQERVVLLKRLLTAGRFSPTEAPQRMKELDSLRWALTILEPHNQKASARQREIERQNAEARARAEHDA